MWMKCVKADLVLQIRGREASKMVTPAFKPGDNFFLTAFPLCTLLFCSHQLNKLQSLCSPASPLSHSFGCCLFMDDSHLWPWSPSQPLTPHLSCLLCTSTQDAVLLCLSESQVQSCICSRLAAVARHLSPWKSCLVSVRINYPIYKWE